MATFNTSKYSPFGKLGKDIKAGKYTSKKEPPKYIFETNKRGRKVKKLNPRWTAWSKRQKTETNKTENKTTKSTDGQVTQKQLDTKIKELKLKNKYKQLSEEDKNKAVENFKKNYKVKDTETGFNVKKKKDEPNPEYYKKKDSPKDSLKVKPKKMSRIEKRNRAIFGDAHVDKLIAKDKDFQAMKKKKITKAEFIRRHPNSITAQKAKGLRK